jgi:FtsP/CotA-like multicopper oxidase with cupredoxin domain
VFGISTPGIPIYQGGLTPQDARKKLNSGTVKPNEINVIGRMGGHTFVMDDGDIDGNNQLFRLRTAKGHQIMMNDTGDFLQIMHANGQSWIELGVEGTVDVFSTNSVSIRTQGDLNLHADQDINMYAGRDIKMKSAKNITLDATVDMSLIAQASMSIYSKATIGIKADGTLALQSEGGSWNGGGSLAFTGGGIDLNGPAAASVTAPTAIEKTTLDDTSFNSSTGWQVKAGALESIVTRAPTHEPYPYHNKGVDSKVVFEEGAAPPPASEPVPGGVEIQAL